MIRPETKEAIEFLNELVCLDPVCIKNLIDSRKSCNEKLANHPTVQVGNYHLGGGYNVGLLGILNGWFGKHDAGDKTGWGAIAAQFDSDSGELIGFIYIDSMP